MNLFGVSIEKSACAEKVFFNSLLQIMGVYSIMKPKLG